MRTIDKIMAQADDYARAWADAQTSNIGYRGVAYAHRAEEQATLRTTITQAIAEARADGAREMRELCATVCDTTPPHPFRRSIEAAHAIRALPLPVGSVNVVMDREHGGLTFAPVKREPVRLTDAEMRQLAEATLYSGSIYDRVRAIEAAVWSANGLEAAR